MTGRMLFRRLLFSVGIILFFLSSILLFGKLNYITEKGLVGRISTGASDSQIQIAMLEHGFMTLTIIGLVIISILLIGFFKDWDKEESKN